MPPTPIIAQAIEQLRDQYIAQGLASDDYQINNGLCEDFAVDLMAMLDHPEGMEMVCNESFMTPGHEAWDWALLETHWNIFPPMGLTAAQVDATAFGGHAFVVFEQRFYDAECPEGADSFFDLPLFSRPLQRTLESLLAPTATSRKPKP
jgi:hypothetical protein